MQVEVLDRTMRVFETAQGHYMLPWLWMAARLDGRVDSANIPAKWWPEAI